MKFARRFKAVLLEQGFPQHWVDSAVPYSQLKKVINKVCSELNEYGLDIASLAQAQPSGEPQNTSDAVRRGSSDGAVAFQYNLDGSTQQFRPKLILFFEDDQAVDATLSSDTRAFLKGRLEQGLPQAQVVKDNLDGLPEDPQVSKSPETGPEATSPTEAVKSTNGRVLRKIEVPLTFDAEFFELLHDDVSSLDAIRAQEQETLTRDILELSEDIRPLAKPTKFGKTDMYAWRDLFELYLQAAVFFSTNECDTGSRNPASAAKQLEWFQSEVKKKGLVSSFKRSESHRALDKFIKINVVLLTNLRFQDINRVAVEKILKKFDKRTNLGAAKMAPRFIQADTLMTQNIAKAVCFQMTQDLVKITPQLDDYLCPVCFTVPWRPIKLRCNHVFCVLCILELQRKRVGRCPVCRGNSVMEADEDAVDEDFGKFLKKHFPKEIKLKQTDLEAADMKAKFGDSYNEDVKCVVM